MTDLSTDFLDLIRKHPGKTIGGGIGSLGSIIAGAFMWSVTEIQRIDERATQTAATLAAHADQEQRNYESLMTVVESVEKTTMRMASDVAVLRYRVDAGAVPASGGRNNFAQALDAHVATE